MTRAAKAGVTDRGPPPSFRLIEIESWTSCREVVVFGRLESEAISAWKDCLDRVLDSDPDYVLIDVDRCEAIDVVAVKQLVVLRELVSAAGGEMLVFGASGQVRRLLEGVGAFDCDPAPPVVALAPRRPIRARQAIPRFATSLARWRPRRPGTPRARRHR